jgi:hypothetical protein
MVEKITGDATITSDSPSSYCEKCHKFHSVEEGCKRSTNDDEENNS